MGHSGLLRIFLLMSICCLCSVTQEIDLMRIK